MLMKCLLYMESKKLCIIDNYIKATVKKRIRLLWKDVKGILGSNQKGNTIIYENKMGTFDLSNFQVILDCNEYYKLYMMKKIKIMEHIL
ncbi:hypothetical protein CWI42_010020 [Ordospora colligata]|nr:hypothetical protein CWI41_010020 [Ordospora colligata]TBU17351.1 hypothetical protein CWI40_010020 [Ordospora colligata]TBU19531.1 hypothetical protein CWI42_010020 [Ordospora colligata]